MEPLQFRVLGPLEVTGPRGGIDLAGPQQQIVLALLLATPNRPVSTDRLIDELWGDESPPAARGTVQAYVANLRRLFRHESDAPIGRRIITKGKAYAIVVDPTELDALEFERGVARGRELSAERPRDAATAFRHALSLWRGEPFAGLSDRSPLLRAEAARLDELHITALEHRIETELAQGDHEAVAGELAALTLAHPLRERFWSSLMLALYRSGRQSDALRAFQDARRVLGEQLGIEPSRALQELEMRILLHDPGLDLPVTTSPIPTNLPAQISSFVGRERQLADALEAVDQSRLVTITGAGGSGKTRLAIEVAARCLDRFPDGVWFVPLGSMSDGSLIATELLGVLGLDSPASVGHREALERQIAGCRSLIVLDNCEHLVQDAAEAAVAMLHAAPGVKVLATSREPLGVTGEVSLTLSPMDLPGHDDITASDVTSSEAVRLFVARAGAVRPGFRIDDANAAVVAEICRRLDGLPLAIELAAVRTRSMGLDAIDTGLEDRFRLLTGGDRTAAPRQRTLADTLDWSYDLLDESLKDLYRRVSVFADAFTLSAAGAVAAGTRSREDVADGLHALVAQSLIAADADTGRYRMLETIRLHARSEMRRVGQTDELGAALLAWGVGLAAEASTRLDDPDHEAVELLQAEHPNIHAALSWALDDDPVGGLELIIPMSQFWWIDLGLDRSVTAKSTSYLRSGAAWAERMLAAAEHEAPAPLWGSALIASGLLRLRLGAFQEATDVLARAEAWFASLGDPSQEGRAVLYRGVSSWSLVPWSQTIALFRRAHELSSEAGNRFGTLFATLMLGWSLVLSGHDPDEGTGYLETFDAAARDSGVPNLVAHAADAMALLALVLDRDPHRVPGLLEEAIREFGAIGHPGCMTHTFHATALHHAKQGEWNEAATILGCARGITSRLAIAVAPYEDRSQLVEEAGLADMDPATRQAAIDAGMAMSYDAAVQYVRDSVTRSRS